MASNAEEGEEQKILASCLKCNILIIGFNAVIK